MKTVTKDAIAKIARGLGMSVVRADDEAVILEDGCGCMASVYRARSEWIVAHEMADGWWRSSDAPAAFLRRNSSLNYFSARSLDGLAEYVRTYRGPVSALRSLVKAMRGY